MEATGDGENERKRARACVYGWEKRIVTWSKDNAAYTVIGIVWMYEKIFRRYSIILYNLSFVSVLNKMKFSICKF